MGNTFCEPTFVIDYDKLLSEIKDFFLLIKVIEHLENKILELEEEKTEITIFNFGTYIFAKEDIEQLKDNNV